MTPLLERLLDGAHLSESEAGALLHALADGTVEPAQAGALLAALRAKGETAEELRGFARAMRERALRPAVDGGPPLADTCGTGGDGSSSFNLSTGAALLAAAAGVRIAKHGNRSISSRSGSADVLEALGVRLASRPEEVSASLAAHGFAFLFAPHFHPAMKAIAPVRRALGVRTVFNLLGPLTNPAAPPFQLVGAFSRGAAEKMAGALAGLGLTRAFVVHGAGGWDEPTPVGPFALLVVENGTVRAETRDPRAYGLPPCAADDLEGGDAPHNAAALRRVFDGERGAHRDAVVLGAALVLELTGRASELREAAAEAAAAIDDGRARRLVERLAAPPREAGDA